MATGQLLKEAEKCDDVCFAKLSFIFRYVQKSSRLTATIGSREVSSARLPLQRISWFISQVFKDFFAHAGYTVFRLLPIISSGIYEGYDYDFKHV